METLNHLINNLKEGLYVCGEKQKFERFFRLVEFRETYKNLFCESLETRKWKG